MITNLKKLATILDLELTGITAATVKKFPLKVTASFLARIPPGYYEDPLLKQILPQQLELLRVRGFSDDPLKENSYTPLPGLVHKYPDRVLLLVNDSCALNCRFCFRRHTLTKITDWVAVFAYIRNNQNITEVILSGGDPLLLAPKKLSAIMTRLATITHLARIRIHTRVPIALPSRVKLYSWQNRLPLIMVLHCNHPHEINTEVAAAVALLHKNKITLFNQSVLLRGVNDNSETLARLSEKLFGIKVIPYYLHLVDKVSGAAHFYVRLKEAKKIYRELQQRLAGYLVPKLVIEVNNRKKYV
jgi:EF-P beta-lysylation protein EpmB